MTPLVLIEHDYRKPEKLSKQVNIFDTFTNRNTDAKQSKITRLFAKNVFMVIILDKFVTLNKDVIRENILNSTQVFKSCFVNEIKNLDIHKN